jgi:hypothetical protein
VKLSDVEPLSGMLAAPNDIAIVGGAKGVTWKTKVSMSSPPGTMEKSSPPVHPVSGGRAQLKTKGLVGVPAPALDVHPAGGRETVATQPVCSRIRMVCGPMYVVAEM